MKRKDKKWTEQDLLILHELRKNSRDSLVNISRKTDIPTSSVFDKINVLQKTIIKKHVSIINFPKLGYGLIAHYILSAEKKDDLQKFLLTHNCTNTISKLDKGSDFFIEAIFKNMKQAEEFTEELQKFEITSFHEHFIAEEIKREAFLSEKEHLSML